MKTDLKTELNKIVFFDGVCGLCNWSVDFLLKRDHKKRLLFSPLQGQTAKQLLGEEKTSQLNTLYFYKDGHLLTKSKAWFAVLSEIKGPWYYLSLPFRLLPYFISDLIYDLVARYRYDLFGKRDSCRLPNAEEKDQFLD